MKLIFDPRIFMGVMIALNALQMGRWLIDGKFVNAFYWLCVAGLNSALLIGLEK